MKTIILRLLYQSGLFGLFHRWRNRDSLTVVLFHRVLPFDLTLPSARQPEWAVTPQVLDHYLRFFLRHYQLVSLSQVRAAAHGGPPLPGRALLITLDDGYVDNLTCAAPVFQQHRAPALLFAVAGDFDGQELWQESVGRAWRQGLLQPADCDRLWKLAAQDEPAPGDWSRGESVTRLLARLQRLPATDRQAALDACSPPLPPRLQDCLMRPAQLDAWARAGFDVGSHGVTHHPLTLSADQEAELALSRQRLLDILSPAGQEIHSVSWPHGRFNDATLAAARRCGYDLFFSTDPALNLAPNGKPGPHLGRIEPGLIAVSGQGEFEPERLARALFLLPRRAQPLPRP